VLLFGTVSSCVSAFNPGLSLGVIFYFPSGRHRDPKTINFGLFLRLSISRLSDEIKWRTQKVANALADRCVTCRAVDVRVQQPNDLQGIMFEVDRTKAATLCRAERKETWPNSVLLAIERQQPEYNTDLLAWGGAGSGVAGCNTLIVKCPRAEPCRRNDAVGASNRCRISAPFPAQAMGQDPCQQTLRSPVSRTTKPAHLLRIKRQCRSRVSSPNVGARDLAESPDIKPIIAELRNCAERC